MKLRFGFFVFLTLVFLSKIHGRYYRRSRFYDYQKSNFLPLCNFDVGDAHSNCLNVQSYAKCSAQDEFRTYDGTCNNLRYTVRGAANTALRRMLPADYLDDGDIPKGFPCRTSSNHFFYWYRHSSFYSKSKRWSPSYPTPHQVSTKLFKITKKNAKNLKGYSTLFMTFGQFLDHDMTLVPHESCKTKSCEHDETYKYPCFPIKFDNNKPDCTSFGRSKPACVDNSFSYTRDQVNTISSFIDGSQIYGSDEKMGKRLRKLDGSGKLKITSKNLLPHDPLLKKECKTLGGCSLVGDKRGDENIALHSMHTLWVREHNRVATKLKQVNSQWKGDRIYNVARKIVTSELQHIAFSEWIPNIVSLPKYSGYNRYQDPSIINAFAAAAFRFGHSLIPNAFSQVNKNYDKLREDVLLQKAFFNTKYTYDYGIESSLMGLIANQSNEVNTELSEGVARKLFIPPGQPGYDDLASRNIQRGRDHGIQAYGLWRQRCHLPALRTFTDLKKYMQKEAVDVFKKLYEHPYDIDLFAAGLAENHLPGLNVGPVFSCIFREQFLGLRDGDRFYYENKDVFTDEQLKQIKRSTLAKIFCDNLKNMVSIQRNVFKVYSNNYPRVLCESIEDIDINAWKEEERSTTSCNIGDTDTNCIAARTSTGFCSRWRNSYRTIDGTCNNFYRPTWGATSTPLRRLTDAMYLDGVETPRGFPCIPNNRRKLIKQDFPTSHEVSRNLFNITSKSLKNTKALSTLYMTFGQFLDHDITLTPHESCRISDCSNIETSYKYPCFPIKFNGNGPRCTGFGRSKPVCRESLDKTSPRDQINMITSFIDGSNIYGSNNDHSERLRTQDGTGKLKLNNDDLLPLDPHLTKKCKTLGGCSLVGDERGDENIALHSMHTLWAREHNRVATKLKQLNSHWDGEKLYQESRKIVGAILQHIVYNEYLPKITKLEEYIWYDYQVDPSIINGFATAAFRFGHSLVPNSFSQLDNNYNKKYHDVLLQRAFFNTTHIRKYGIESTILGLMGNQSGQTNTEFSEGVGRKLFIPFGDQAGYDDLMARNIQRGRDHGIPTYGNWRQKCGLKGVNSFTDLENYMDKKAVAVFKKMYSDPNDIDLFAAGMAEYHYPGLIVGPTFSCIFKHQFEALRTGDRYFYANHGIFTYRQYNSLKKVTLAKVMCNNLKGLVSIQKDVFYAYYAGAKRVECSSIPDLDLSKWKDGNHHNY